MTLIVTRSKLLAETVQTKTQMVAEISSSLSWQL